MVFSPYDIWRTGYDIIIRIAIWVLATVPFMLAGSKLNQSGLKLKDVLAKLAVVFGFVIGAATAFLIPADMVYTFKVFLEQNILGIVGVLAILFIIAALLKTKK